MLVHRVRRWPDLGHFSAGGGPEVVVSIAAFHARVRGSVPGFGGLKETKKMFLPHPRAKVTIVGSLRYRAVACSASAARARISNPVSGGQCQSQSSHYLQEVLLAQFSLYVHKGGLKPDSFHFLSPSLSELLITILIFSVIFRIWRIKTVPALKEFIIYNGHRPIT